jgi:hypothetical protein
MSAAQDGVSRAKQLIALLRRDAEDGVSVLAFISVGQTDAAVGAFDPGKGHVPILVRAALLQRLVMTVARLHDSAGDVDSLPTLFKLLDDSTVRDQFLAGPEFDASLTFARERWAKFHGDARVESIRLFRNRYLAHMISQKWGFDTPVFGDITDVAAGTFGIVEALSVASGTSVLLKHVHEIWKERAEDYWRRLIPRS